MPGAAYAATTELESTFGDFFTAEISDLRVAEQVPYVQPGFPPVHIQPLAPAYPAARHSRPSRRPSNIIPIGRPLGPNNQPSDVFYLGLDLEFVGTKLGQPGFPDTVSVEVRFFLEAYGVAGTAGPHRHEINIAPQTFLLNANPKPTGGNILDRETRHSLWVEVWEGNPLIIEAPAINSADPAGGSPITWADLFTSETIYRVAAAVKFKDVTWIPLEQPAGTGFIEGLVIQTEAYDPNVV